MKKKILLYPGSFSPMHIGHLCLANYMIESRPEFDELWFLLTPSSPFKNNPNQLLPEDFRRRWAEHVVGKHPRLKVSLEEFELPKPNFTYDTLEHLRAEFTDYDFSLLVGMDSLISLPRWHRGLEIMAETPIFVYPRPGYTLEMLEVKGLPDSITLLEQVPTFDISSTRIRRMLAEGHELPYFLSTETHHPLYHELVQLVRN